MSRPGRQVKMIPYKSRSGKPSGVATYEIGQIFIIVRFGSRDYKYSYASCGREITENMKRLARASKGLSTFISQENPDFE